MWYLGKRLNEPRRTKADGMASEVLSEKNVILGVDKLKRHAKVTAESRQRTVPVPHRSSGRP